MKKWLLSSFALALLVCFLPLSACGQNTTVTATVTDPNSVAYVFSTGYAALVCPGNAAATFNGFSVPRTFTITGFDGTGTFTQVVYDVSQLQPSGCGYQWHITYKDGVTSFITATITAVTGSSVNLSATISSYAVAIPSSSAPIGGTIANTQVAVGSGPSTVAGTNNFIYTVGNGELTVQNTNNSGVPSLNAVSNVASGVQGYGMQSICTLSGTSTCNGGSIQSADTGSANGAALTGLSVGATHNSTGTLASEVGLQLNMSSGNGAGVASNSYGINIGSVTWLSSSALSHQAIFIDDQCKGAFPPATCLGLHIVAPSGGNLSAQFDGPVLINATASTQALVSRLAGNYALGSVTFPYLNLIIGGVANQTTSVNSLATANRVVYWPDAGGNASLATVEYCGATSGATQACAKTVQTLPIVVWGDVLLNTAASQSITTLPFTDALYSCSGSDLTNTAATINFNTYTSASVTIVESGGGTSDHLRWSCIGH
jgi:hypothetical protein